VISSVARVVALGAAPILAAAVVVGTGLTASPRLPDTGSAIRLVDESNPLAGRPFYVDPISGAKAAAGSNPQLTALANTPTAYWLDEAFASPAGTVSRYASAAQAAGATPVFALYAIPHRDCGSFAAGGFATAAGYRQWVDSVAAGLGSMPAAIILEPDAIAMADCLSADQQQERFGLLSYAVDALTRDPAAAVYIDGGHSRWLSADVLASRLNQVGVSKARGFSLNTANFYTTQEEIGFGDAVSGLTGGAHYVIDTSRNGAGPAEGTALDWCNPGGRALGVAPTTNTASPNVDAYLWVKRPGESDGSCNRGEPPAGRFVSGYAMELIHNAGG
jgi:endoglucanase